MTFKDILNIFKTSAAPSDTATATGAAVQQAGPRKDDGLGPRPLIELPEPQQRGAHRHHHNASLTDEPLGPRLL